MKRATKKIMISCVITISCVVYAAQEPARAPQEPEDEKLVYLTVGALQDFQQEMEEAIVGDLVQEHKKEVKAQEDLAQARLELFRQRLEAEQKSEQEILAALKIEQDKYDAEMEALVKKHGEAQHAKMAEFFGGLGHGQDRDWQADMAAQDGEQESPEVSGSEDEQDWDNHFLAASIVGTEQAGDL